MRTTKCKPVFTGLLLAAVALPLWASPSSPPTCTAPSRPVNDQDDVLWQQFLDQIDSFRSCTQARKVWYEQAALDDQQQARAAVQAWNDFVAAELNAPKDFPHPKHP